MGIVAVFGIKGGHKWQDFEQAILKGITLSLGAIFEHLGILRKFVNMIFSAVKYTWIPFANTVVI